MLECLRSNDHEMPRRPTAVPLWFVLKTQNLALSSFFVQSIGVLHFIGVIMEIGEG